MIKKFTFDCEYGRLVVMRDGEKHGSEIGPLPEFVERLGAGCGLLNDEVFDPETRIAIAEEIGRLWGEYAVKLRGAAREAMVNHAVASAMLHGPACNCGEGDGPGSDPGALPHKTWCNAR